MTDPKDTTELRAEALPTLYKALHYDSRVGTAWWPLPSGDKPGEWVEVSGKVIPCLNGLHLCREQDLLNWLRPGIFEAEHEGELVVHADGTTSSKVVARKARLIRRVETWDERTARLFAADCAERALPIFERAHPNDLRPRKAIEAARAYARGEIDKRALGAAREDAWGAVEVVWTRAAALEGATAAAVSAARAAEGSAHLAAANAIARAIGEDAGGAAWAAERAWQTKRLLQYLRGKVDD